MFKYLVCLISNHRYKVTKTIDGGVYIFCNRCVYFGCLESR